MRSHTSVMEYSLELLQNHKPLIFTAGIASVGLTAAYYSSGMQAKIYMILTSYTWVQLSFLSLCCVDPADSIPWKLFYVAGCLFVAMQNMEEWEEAVFDKTKNLIELKTFSLYTLVLTLWRKGQEKGE